VWGGTDDAHIVHSGQRDCGQFTGHPGFLFSLLWVKQSFIAEQIHANYATKTHFLVDTQQLLISATQHPWHV
jgi:hypothetical protein